MCEKFSLSELERSEEELSFEWVDISPEHLRVV
jgi:hypothetical protein